jgi:MoCo/4Fe-4S cofactor protein with predicted Tat translocation signal
MHNHSHDTETEKSPTRNASLEAMNAKLAGKKGKLYWKTFEELAATEEFQQFVDDEFPNRASLMQVDRRKFLSLGGAAFAMAGLSGCRFLPQMKAVPYVRAPEEMVPGRALMYTSTMTRAGYGFGVLVESHEGRPTKIEGNPAHPASLGATDVWAQAEILSMYDPDRSQAVKSDDESASWEQFWTVAQAAMKAQAAGGGAGLAFLSETLTSPTLAAQRKSLLAKYPNARWVEYEPATRDNVYGGTKLAFGKPVSPVYRIQNAKVIVSLDSDFLLTDGNNSNVRYARDFADGRRLRLKGAGAGKTPTMNRLYAFDTGYTITGASADHRIAIRPSQLEAVARALYVAAVGGPSDAPAGVDQKLFTALVKDLTDNRGAAVVIPGDDQPANVHAYAHALNSVLGAIGKTVEYIAPAELAPGGQVAGLKSLTDAMNAGSVKALFILGGNPVYNAPGDLAFGKALLGKTGGQDNVPLRVRFGRYEDETSALCHWHLPESHPLEAWSDARAFDGTASIVQPLIAPLYDTRSIHELVAELSGEPQPGYDLVHDHWAGAQTTAGTAVAWETMLVKGVVAHSAAPTVAVTAATGLDTSLPAPAAAPTLAKSQVEVAIRPDSTIYDGRYANNSWLQETPKPITTITWDNSAQMSPGTAQNLGIVGNDKEDKLMRHPGDVTGKQLVTLTVGKEKVTLPVWILPGQPENVVTVHLGFGRTAAGQVGTDQGADVYPIRNSDSMGYAVATVAETAGEYQIAATQAYHSLMGINEDHNRDVILAGTLEEFIKKNGKIAEADDVEYHIPEVRAYPGDDPKVNFTNPDGSLGQNANMNGAETGMGSEIIADSYRKEWAYTDKSLSNDKGWPTVYPEFSNKGFNAWAMGIDLTTCIGCNACSIACQAENNVPTVGKEQVGKGRHMHWLRIDHYYAGPDMENVESYFQPLACVQCEKAPCEPVCPVAATVHSHEGINQMVYNRCIGTRYCSNNCPYKVRRFNFLKWTAGIGGPTTVNYDLPVLKMLANPEVTVRGRGVMEKCNYCIQRINETRIEAKKAEREIRDGDVVTACQQACPTEAIAFGDINDPNSIVSQWRSEAHDYSLLSDLNTRPRTTYLGRIKNPNPAIAAGKAEG